MGAYSYCKCHQGLDAATFFEIQNEEQQCPACHRQNRPNRTLAEACVQLEQQVETLTERLNNLRDTVNLNAGALRKLNDLVNANAQAANENARLYDKLFIKLGVARGD